MSAYSWSLIKYLKSHYHCWRAERLIRKMHRMRAKIREMEKELVRHTEIARELVDEMKW